MCVDNYSRSLLALWPTSSAVSGSNPLLATFIFSAVQAAPENFGTLRVDYKIGSNDSLFGTFLRDEAEYTQPDAFNDVLSLSSTIRTTIALEETHTFSSNFVNAVRVGFNRDNVLNTFTPTAINPGRRGIGRSAGIVGQSAPRLSVGGGITDFFGGVESGSHYLHAWNSYQYGDDAFWTHGAHTIKFGGSVERMLYNEHTFQNPGGRYIFNNGSGVTPLNRIEQFLGGMPSHYEAGLLNIVDNPREFRQTTFGLYAQDDWKFKSNLTFNIGLRYEPTTVLKDAQGRITNLADDLRHFSHMRSRNSPPRSRRSPARRAAVSARTIRIPRCATLNPAWASLGIRSRTGRLRFAAASGSTTSTRLQDISSCSKIRRRRS